MEQAVQQIVIQPSISTAFWGIIDYTVVIADRTNAREQITLYWGQLLVIN